MLESLFNKVGLVCFDTPWKHQKVFRDIEKDQAYKFIKKSLQYRCFPLNFPKFLRTRFSQHIFPDNCFCSLIYICSLLTGSWKEDGNNGKSIGSNLVSFDIKNLKIRAVQNLLANRKPHALFI